MINHKTNYDEMLLPEAHRRLIREARRELQNKLLPLLLKYHNPEITAVWEMATSAQDEYTILLKGIYSNIPKLNGLLQSYLKEPLMGYLALPQNFRVDRILKEKNKEASPNEQSIQDTPLKPY